MHQNNLISDASLQSKSQLQGIEQMRQIQWAFLCLAVVGIAAGQLTAGMMGPYKFSIPSHFQDHDPGSTKFPFGPPSSFTPRSKPSSNPMSWNPKKVATSGHHYSPSIPKVDPHAWKKMEGPGKHFAFPGHKPSDFTCFPFPWTPSPKPGSGSSDWCNDFGSGFPSHPGFPKPGYPKPGHKFPPYCPPPFCPPPFCPPPYCPPPECPTTVPEPTSFALFGLGALGMGAVTRYRRRKKLELDR